MGYRYDQLGQIDARSVVDARLQAHFSRSFR